MKNKNNRSAVYNNLGTPEARKAVEQSLHHVFNALAEPVADELASHWRGLFKADMSPGSPLPVGTHPKYFRQQRAKYGFCIPLLWVERGLLCDIEFFETAPAEVADSVVAFAFADAYITAKGVFQGSGEEQFLACKELMGKWGFFPEELELWYAVRLARPGSPLVNYYASRFAMFGLVPPATADLVGIAALLKQKGYHEHAESLTVLASRLN